MLLLLAWVLVSITWYTLPIAVGFNSYTIVHLDMLNVLVALKLWAPSWGNKRVKLYCDNQAVVQVLSTSNTREAVLGVCAPNIWLITAMYNGSIDFTPVTGIQILVADLLSRWKHDSACLNQLYQFIPNLVSTNTHIDVTLLNYDI